MGQKLDRVILIVEDSPIDYEITTRALRRAGFDQNVLHCESGDEAMAFLEGGSDIFQEKGYPGIILLDLNMPGTDGRDVLNQIKNRAQTKMIPVIILTTSNNEHDIEECYMKGANSYIQKPTAPDDYTEMAGALKKFWFDWSYLPEV